MGRPSWAPHAVLFLVTAGKAWGGELAVVRRRRRLCSTQYRDVANAAQGDECIHALVHNPATAPRGVSEHELAIAAECDQAGVKEIQVWPPGDEADQIAVEQELLV